MPPTQSRQKQTYMQARQTVAHTHTNTLVRSFAQIAFAYIITIISYLLVVVACSFVLLPCIIRLTALIECPTRPTIVIIILKIVADRSQSHNHQNRNCLEKVFIFITTADVAMVIATDIDANIALTHCFYLTAVFADVTILLMWCDVLVVVDFLETYRVYVIVRTTTTTICDYLCRRRRFSVLIGPEFVVFLTVIFVMMLVVRYFCCHLERECDLIRRSVITK